MKMGLVSGLSEKDTYKDRLGCSCLWLLMMELRRVALMHFELACVLDVLTDRNPISSICSIGPQVSESVPF
jgi:hypothetical protein